MSQLEVNINDLKNSRLRWNLVSRIIEENPAGIIELLTEMLVSDDPAIREAAVDIAIGLEDENERANSRWEEAYNLMLKQDKFAHLLAVLLRGCLETRKTSESLVESGHEYPNSV